MDLSNGWLSWLEWTPLEVFLKRNPLTKGLLSILSCVSSIFWYADTAIKVEFLSGMLIEWLECAWVTIISRKYLCIVCRRIYKYKIYTRINTSLSSCSYSISYIPILDLGKWVIFTDVKLMAFFIQNIPVLGEFGCRKMCLSSFCTTSDSPVAIHFVFEYRYRWLSADTNRKERLYSSLGFSPLIFSVRAGNSRLQ